MKISRQTLLEALNAVRPGLARRDVVEQATSFVFIDGAVCTYNDEIAVSHPLEVDFEGAVPAKKFFDMINKSKADEIEFEITDGELLLKGGRAKTGLRLEGEVKLPIQDVGLPDEDDYTDLPENFAEAVKFCLFSVCRDPNKPVLSCVHVAKSFAESSDNNRITRYEMGKAAAKSFPEELLIPAFAAKSIVEYSPTEYALTDGWLHFKNEMGATFSCRVFDEDFPDFSKFLVVKGSDLEFPDILSDMLDRANVMSDDQRVTVSLEKNKLTISADGADGWFEEPVRIKYDGEEIEFDIQPEFMKTMIKSNRKAVLGKEALKFEGEKYSHVVRLMEPKGK